MHSEENENIRKKKSLIRVLISGVLYGAYSLLAAEIMLRLLSPVPILPRYVCETSYGIRGNEPNRQYWHRTSEYQIQIRTNSKGIRADREFSYEKDPDVFRIILLGDSFGMGYGADLEDSWITLTEENLKKLTGRRVEIINLSSSGHGNAEELIVLENEGVRYHPDIVLLAWHSTDLKDNIRSNLYRLENGKLIRQAAQYLPGVKARAYLARLPFYRFIAENSQLYNCIRDQSGSWVKQILAQFRAAPPPVKVDAADTQSGKVPELSYEENLTIALLNRICELSEQLGARFVLLDIPTRAARDRFNSELPHVENLHFADHIYSPIHDFEQQNGKMLYWEKSHGHFSKRGCEVVALGLSQALAALIPAIPPK